MTHKFNGLPIISMVMFWKLFKKKASQSCKWNSNKKIYGLYMVLYGLLTTYRTTVTPCFFHPADPAIDQNQAARQSSVRIHGEMLGQCSAACDAWAGGLKGSCFWPVPWSTVGAGAIARWS